MKFNIPSYYLSLLFLFLPGAGWTQSQDTVKLKRDDNAGLNILLAERWFVSDQHFDGTGEVRNNLVEYGYYSSLLEVDYGISERWSFNLHFPFLNYTYTVTPLSLQKVAVWTTGDPDVGLTYRLFQGRSISINAGLYLGVPLGFHGQGALNTGDGEFNQLFKLKAGSPVKTFDRHIWWTIYTGFNHRTRQYAEEFLFGAQGGRELIREKLVVSVGIDGIKALGKLEGAGDINPQSLFSNFRELLIITPRMGFQIHPKLQAGIDMGIPISGRNIFSNPRFGLSLLWQNEIP